MDKYIELFIMFPILAILIISSIVESPRQKGNVDATSHSQTVLGL